MDWAATRSEPLGVLELASGRPDLAVQAFERVPIDMGKVAADTIAPRSFVPAYVDALVQVGRQAEARMIAAAYAEAAQRTTRRLAIGLGRRCLGIAHGSVGQLSEAARAFDEIGNRYEMARTNLCAGQLLRRRGKQTEAARVLAEALDDFTLVGADGWAERARAELVAVGAPMRGPTPPRHSQLTPQERTVARLVAGGLTNREVAERLFVTTNTIETHLKHIYQKLEVRSRTELAIAFRD
jgi:DNA-binding CsgD family transcriptional regulator